MRWVPLPQMNDDYWDLADRLVPDHGVAATVQGELVRAVLRVTAECSRNGLGNWDDYFEALTEFALERFSDGTIDPRLADRARAALERLRDHGRIADTLPESAIDDLCSEHHDDLLEHAAAEWCRCNPSPIAFQPGPDYGASD